MTSFGEEGGDSLRDLEAVPLAGVRVCLPLGCVAWLLGSLELFVFAVRDMLAFLRGATFGLEAGFTAGIFASWVSSTSSSRISFPIALSSLFFAEFFLLEGEDSGKGNFLFGGGI